MSTSFKVVLTWSWGGGKYPDSYMGVSKNRGGPPKWMVYNGKALLKWMIWGKPPIFGNIHVDMLLNVPNRRIVFLRGDLWHTPPEQSQKFTFFVWGG